MNYITMQIRITSDKSLEPGKTYLVSASEIIPRSPGPGKTYLVSASEVTPRSSEDSAQAASAFTIPSDIEERLSQLLTDSKLRDTGVLKGYTARARSFGIELFNYLFQSEVKKLYYEIKARAVRQQAVMRLRLQILPAELSTLPWELLHDGEHYLCLSSRPMILFARVPDVIGRKKLLSYQPPLRLLGITASPSGGDELNIETEKEYINTALAELIQEKRVEIEWRKAEPSVLRDLRFDNPWHVLHFIGHGYFEDKEDKENRQGKLIFEDSRGNRFDFDANRLNLALLDGNIQLVFLNACDTARGDPLNYLSNFAYRLAISGTPAIVAMQFKITDAAAIQFARVFYDRIARGDPVDEAVTKARHHIHIYVGANANQLEWIAPILYISTSNSTLFKDTNAVSAKRKRGSSVDKLQQDQSGSPVLPATSGKENGSTPKMVARLNRFPLWTKIATVVVFLCLVLSSLSFYVFRPSAPPTTFCLATNLPLNGPNKEIGRSMQHGIELALQQSLLSKSAYHGYHLVEYDMDDTSPQQNGASDPTVGVRNLTSLAQQTSCPNPIAVIGPYNSSIAVSEIPIAATNHILLLSPTNSAPCLTQRYYSTPTCVYDQIHPQGFPNTYARLPATDRDQGYLDADFLSTSTNPGQGGLGAGKIEIVGDENIYGTQVSQAVIEELRHNGVTPVGVDCIKSARDYQEDHLCSQLNPGVQAFSDDNIAALAAKIRDEGADAIFFGGLDVQRPALLRQKLGELGLDQVPFVGVGVLVASADTFFKTIGPHAANVYATSAAANPSSLVSGTGATFSRQYQMEFKQPPGNYSPGSYDAANIIIQVIKNLIDAGMPVTKDSVVQAVLGHEFVGVVGNRIHFNSDGDNIGQRVYTIYKSQQQSQDVWGWQILTTQQTG